MPDETTCPTVLLSDLPAENDEFGSHRRIADAIADLTLGEEGGRAIALTGTWGSGKSTVIKLLAAAVGSRSDAEPTTRVAVFDAWSHQGDPLRRTFLEWLINELQAAPEWLNPEDKTWSKLKDEMSKRQKDETITKTPSLTPIGWVVAFLYLLTPAAIGLFLKVGSPDLKGVLAVLPWVGLGVLLLPSIIVTAAALHWWANDKPASGAFAALVNKTTEITSSTSLQTVDPTSIEFQQNFHKILGAALSERRRRLVLVIDNLDRMCNEESLSIWATMRTFFDARPDACLSWMERLWLVIPYDHRSLTRLWQAGGNGAAPAAAIAESFIEKTFQVRFHVPQPVMSDWRVFLDGALRKAFPNHSDAERHSIYRLYRAYYVIKPRPNGASSPTPRDIKMFVNDLGAIHRQWCHDGIGLPDQALFVLMVRGGVRVFEALRDKDDVLLGDRRIREIVSDQVQRSLAAMLFNVKPNKAYQALLGQGVEQYLTAGNGGMLSELTVYDGFCEVCEQVVSDMVDDWVQSDHRSLACAAAAVDSIVDDFSGNQCWSGVKVRLRSGAEQVPQWDLRDAQTVNGLIALMKIGPSTKFAATLIKAACAGEAQKAELELERSTTVTSDWIDSACRLVSWIVANRPNECEDVLSEAFCVPGSAARYVATMRALDRKGDPDHLSRYFRPAAMGTGIIAELETLWSEGNLSADDSSVIVSLLTVAPSLRWSPFIAKIREDLGALQDTEPKQGCTGAVLLLALSTASGEAKEALHDLATSGRLMYWFYTSHEADPVVEARIAFAFIREVRALSLESDVGNSAAGLQRLREALAAPQDRGAMVGEFADLIRQHDELSVVLALCADAKTKPFGSEVMKILVRSKDAFTIITPATIVASDAELHNALGRDEYLGFIERAVREGGLRSYAVSQPFDAESSDLYEEMLEIEGAPFEGEYQEFIVTGLRRISAGKWHDMLRDNDGTIDLLASAVRLGVRLELTTYLFDGLLAYTEEVLNGAKPSGATVEHFGAILSALHKDHRKNLVTQVAQRFLRHDGQVGPFIILYGAVLLERIALLKAEPDHLVDVTFRHILDEKEQASVSWMIDVLGRMPRLFRDRASEIKERFEDRLRDARKEMPETVQAQVDGLCDVLGLKPKPEPVEETTSGDDDTSDQP